MVLVENYWDYFEVVVVVHFLVAVGEVLYELPVRCVSLQILDVGLHYCRFVCDREIEGVIAQPEL